MSSFKKSKLFFPLVFILLLLLQHSCSDRSEFGEASDYEKYGATATATATATGSGTIKGNVVSYIGNNILTGVSVSYDLSSTIVGNAATTDSSGDFIKSSLETGAYTLSYSLDNYEDETQTATLERQNDDGKHAAKPHLSQCL